jgi:hypothetical protein
MKKVVVTATSSENKDSMCREFATELNVFERVVEFENIKPDSLYNFNIMLTLEEADKLKEDPRVQDIRIGSKQENGISVTYGQSVTRNVSANAVSISNTESNFGLPSSSLLTDPLNGGSSLTTVNFERTLTGNGVDIIIVDTGVLRDHPELGGRVVELNWPEVTGTTALYPWFTMADQYDQRYPIQNSHGTCMAGLAAGNTCGWAPDALIYPMRVYGANNFSLNQSVNLARLWHLSKVAAGNTRPTIYCISSSFFVVNAVQFTSINYQGSSYAVSNASSNAEKALYKFTSQFAFTGLCPFYSIPFAVDCKAATDAGVLVVVNSGNNGFYQDVVNGPDWENSIQTAGGTKFNYNRGANPSSTLGVVNVANISTTLLSGLRAIETSSNRGPGVTIYASGQNTVTCCTSGTNQGLPGGVFTCSVNTQYLGTTDTNYRLGKFGGTSAASPQVAGILATWAESNRYLTGYDAVSMLNQYKLTDRIYTPPVNFLDGYSLWGDTGRFAYNAFATTTRAATTW